MRAGKRSRQPVGFCAAAERDVLLPAAHVVGRLQPRRALRPNLPEGRPVGALSPERERGCVIETRRLLASPVNRDCDSIGPQERLRRSVEGQLVDSSPCSD